MLKVPLCVRRFNIFLAFDLADVAASNFSTHLVSIHNNEMQYLYVGRACVRAAYIRVSVFIACPCLILCVTRG